jgi:hypothetical protein
VERQKKNHETGERDRQQEKRGEEQGRKKITSCGINHILYVIKHYFSFSGLKLFVFFKGLVQCIEVM